VAGWFPSGAASATERARIIHSLHLLDVIFKALGEHSVDLVDNNVLHFAEMEMALAIA
jgi:hypothetical protein